MAIATSDMQRATAAVRQHTTFSRDGLGPKDGSGGIGISAASDSDSNWHKSGGMVVNSTPAHTFFAQRGNGGSSSEDKKVRSTQRLFYAYVLGTLLLPSVDVGVQLCTVWLV